MASKSDAHWDSGFNIQSCTWRVRVDSRQWTRDTVTASVLLCLPRGLSITTLSTLRGEAEAASIVQLSCVLLGEKKSYDKENCGVMESIKLNSVRNCLQKISSCVTRKPKNVFSKINFQARLEKFFSSQFPILTHPGVSHVSCPFSLKGKHKAQVYKQLTDRHIPIFIAF